MNDQLIFETTQEYTKLLEAGKLALALPLIRQAAHWADVDSQILAERIYLHEAYGHPIDYRSGFEYALLAAMNGDLQSMHDLGMIYKKGYGAAPDLEKAKYWLEKAERLGFKDQKFDA